MKRSDFVKFFTLILLVSCAPSAPTPISAPLTVQYSFATIPWLKSLYNCAGNQPVSAELCTADLQDIRTADLVMRISSSVDLPAAYFQIGTDDLLVIVNNQNPINKLTADQVRSLFTGRIQTWKPVNGNVAPVQVWVFPVAEDVQQVFEYSILNDSPVTSLARLASTPEGMTQAVSNDVNAIGIITRRWKTENTSEVFTAASSLPVLAITKSDLHGGLSQILACLQK
jgi:hypothetical protein